MNPNFWAEYRASRPTREGAVPHRCPRRTEGPFFDNDVELPDAWSPDDTCTYCGGLDPLVFMARLEAGDVTLTPTDKNYKVYIRNDGGATFKMTYRGKDDPGGDDPTKWVWTTEDREETKFYFMHLDGGQRQRFIDLLNANRLRLNEPGYFYRLPYFCVPREMS